MIHYTVLIPQRDAIDAVGHLLPRLEPLLERLILPYEFISVDDASQASSTAKWEPLLDRHPCLRVLQFDEPRGTSAALSAGIAAARGDLIIAVAAQSRFRLQDIPQLIARLSSYDLVVARHEQTLDLELRDRLAGFPRLLAAHPQLHPAEDLFWAARREAVAGLALGRGAFRMLPALVAKRGFRVCHLVLGEGLPARGVEYRLDPARRLATTWLDRRFEPHLARELSRGELAQPQRTMARGELGRTRVLPQTDFTPAKTDQRGSA